VQKQCIMTSGSPLMCKLNWVVCSIEINDYFYIFD